MLRFFLIVFISLTLLQASQLEDSCTEDMSKMFSSYYKADRYKVSGNFNDSIYEYEMSIESAYLALESCTENSNYDLNIMYAFILESENSIYSIYNQYLLYE